MMKQSNLKLNEDRTNNEVLQHLAKLREVANRICDPNPGTAFIDDLHEAIANVTRVMPEQRYPFEYALDELCEVTESTSFNDGDLDSLTRLITTIEWLMSLPEIPEA